MPIGIGCSTASGRSRSRRRTTPTSRPTRTADGSPDLAATSTEGVRSADQADYLAVARAERANIDAALAWCATHDPERGLQIATGFGWAWIVLGDSRGADRLRAATASIDGLLLTAWIEASTGALVGAREHIAQAQALADDAFAQAKCLYHLAYVVSHEGDFAQAIELTAQARALYGDDGPPWDRAANALFALRAATSAADRARAVELRGEVERCLAMVDDPWLHTRGEAMLGELARLEGRFDDAVTHLERAIAVSRGRGYLQTEAYQQATLGRAQCQAGDYEAGAASLRLAIEKAEAIGDVRMAALARVHLGRVERALGHDDAAHDALVSACAWHRAAGGGEQALLGECLLAAMDGDIDRLQRDPRRIARAPRRGVRPRRARACRGGRRADGARVTLHLRTRPGGPMNRVQRRARPLARAGRPAERDRARARRRVPDHDGRADAGVRAVRRHDPDRVRRARPLDVDLRRDRHADLRGVDVAHRRLELAPDDGAPHPHVRHRRAARRTSSRSSRRESCAAGSRSPSRRAAPTCRRSARRHAATATRTSSTARRPGSRTAAAATASPCS